jgi:Extensin-like protein C-terminus
MTCGVRWYLVSSLVLVTLITLAGCSHYMLAEREPWRHEAEASCLGSGAVKETPERVRIAAINGPGACGIDYPLRISALGDSALPFSYSDEAVRPPSSVPGAAAPQNWPGAQPTYGVQSGALPPLQQSAPQSYPVTQSYPAPQAQIGQPLSLSPPGLPAAEQDEDIGIPGGPPHPYYGGPSAPVYSPRQAPAQAQSPPGVGPIPPLGPPGGPMVTASAGPVEVQPAATLACPLVSMLDQWINTAVQPAALHWFRQPVVQIKQISAYSCRGMNGDPNAHISEHAFGNALDVAEFDLADGHKVSVQYGWHGTPEEQGFLHDVQSAACDDFTTVLAPGANVYHYNHIHVDLMRHYNSRHICEPSAVPGEVAAARARSQFAAQHPGERYGDPGVTGSISARLHKHAPDAEDDDRLPDAVAGDD